MMKALACLVAAFLLLSGVSIYFSRRENEAEEAHHLSLAGGRHSGMKTRFTSPRCCHTTDCLQLTRARTQTGVFLTTLRTEEYLVLLKELHCSLFRHNPGAQLLVAVVPGDLSKSTLNEIAGLENVTCLEWEDIYYPNTNNARFSYNWVKLRAWSLEEHAAIIMLDADGIVLGNLKHLFDLPTDFAWTSEQGMHFHWNSGGLVFLRPCKAVFDHMMTLLATEHLLRFRKGLAEQDFIKWYFQHTGMRLPAVYNSNYQLYIEGGREIPGGEGALFLHFGSEDKPFVLRNDSSEWRYMCHRRKPLLLS